MKPATQRKERMHAQGNTNKPRKRKYQNYKVLVASDGADRKFSFLRLKVLMLGQNLIGNLQEFRVGKSCESV